MASSIEAAARKLTKKVDLGAYTDKDVQNVVKAVHACDTENNEQCDRLRELAREKWAREGECEIDDDAVVSVSRDKGAYVQAWVWVDLPVEEQG